MHSNPHRRTAGFTLLEALVALVLLALGLLAGALMQFHALRSAREAVLHTRALQLAEELAEIMTLSAGAGHGAPDPAFFAIDVDGASAPAAPDCLAPQSTCNAGAWVRFEIAGWTRRLGAQLPHARAVVCRDSQPWDATRAAYVWRCAGAGGPPVIKIGWHAPLAAQASPGAAASTNTSTEGDSASRVVLQLAGGRP